MKDPSILIEPRAVAPMMKNGYILACRQSSRAAYIDPGDEAEDLLAFVDREKLVLQMILNTHGHMDHICGIRRVKREWDIPIFLHPEDEFLYQALKKQAEWFGFRYEPAPPVDRFLDDEARIQLGEVSVRVIHTPGHSPGSVSFLVGNHLFCGDLVFAGSVGRTDLPGGAPRLLLKTIREKVLPLGDDTLLYPGHGPCTTVGREKLTNPFLNGELF